MANMIVINKLADTRQQLKLLRIFKYNCCWGCCSMSDNILKGVG